MKENKMLPFEHVIECAVPIKFAWQFWTDVRNWRLDSDVDAVELSGPFAAGSAGATLTHSMGRIEWRILSVEEEREAILEVSAVGAVIHFRWNFEDLGNCTRMIQRVSIPAEPSSLTGTLAAELEIGIPAGMRKLCEVMEQTAAALGRRNNPRRDI